MVDDWFNVEMTLTELMDVVTLVLVVDGTVVVPNVNDIFNCVELAEAGEALCD